MPGLRVRLYVALIASMVAGFACGDYSRSTSPLAVDGKASRPTLIVTSPFSLVPHGSMAQAVKWGSTHENIDQRASAVIGPDGGTLSLPGADFSMTIPPGALIKPTRITVVARGGSYVVYDMFPHGLKFLQPVTAVQGLSTTAGYGTPEGNAVRTAYLSGGKERIRLDGFASAAELQRATTYFYGAQPIAETQEWILAHFSRYILISGVWVEVPDDYPGSDKSNGLGSGPINVLPDTTLGPDILPADTTLGPGILP